MPLAEWQDSLGTCATATTIIQFLIGIQVCAGFYSKKTTGESSCLTFLAGVCMSCVCFNYGKLIQNQTLQTVNATGFVLQMLYSFVFYKYTKQRVKTGRMIMMVVIFVVLVQTYVSNEEDLSKSQIRVGMLGAILSISYSSAPLANLQLVFKSKNTESLPFYLILATVFATGQWTLYGFIIEDNIIEIPNFIGFIAAFFQLSLFFCIPSLKSEKTVI